jgi:hypothetical protein
MQNQVKETTENNVNDGPKEYNRHSRGGEVRRNGEAWGVRTQVREDKMET